MTCIALLGQPTLAMNIDCKNFNHNQQFILNNVRNVCKQCSAHDGVSASGAVFIFNNDTSMCIYCSAVNVTGASAIGFQIGNSDNCFYCAVVNLTGTTTDGFLISGDFTVIDHPLVHNVTRDGIRFSSTGKNTVIQNGIFSTAINGINNSSGTTLRQYDIYNDFNYTYNVSGSAVLNLTAGANSVTLTRTPFINSGGLDFRLNNNFGGGASVRAHGTPATILGLSGTGYPDAGVSQHQDPKFF